MVDGGEDKYKVEVLKNALKSAADERKQLLLQVSELKKELGRRGSFSKGGGAGGKDETDSSAGEHDGFPFYELSILCSTRLTLALL
jgi:hypothetical protein